MEWLQKAVRPPLDPAVLLQDPAILGTCCCEVIRSAELAKASPPVMVCRDTSAACSDIDPVEMAASSERQGDLETGPARLAFYTPCSTAAVSAFSGHLPMTTFSPHHRLLSIKNAHQHRLVLIGEANLESTRKLPDSIYSHAFYIFHEDNVSEHLY